MTIDDEGPSVHDEITDTLFGFVDSPIRRFPHEYNLHQS